MKLHVQSFLIGAGMDGDPLAGLSQLTAVCGITVKQHPKYPELYHLCYDQLEAPKGHPIVNECRGLILNSADNWAVVAYPFNRFANHGESWAAEIDWSSVVVQEKIDGCYPYSALLNLWGGGTIKIGEVVKKQLTPDLIGMDENGNLIKCHPTNWFNNGRKKYWLRITTDSVGRITTDSVGKSKGVLIVTPNHEIFVNGKFRPAIDAQPGDTMLRHMQSPCPSTLHLIRSSLLGDGSISPTHNAFRFSISHIKQHAGYNTFFEQSLGAFAVASRNLISGYGSQMIQVSSVTTPALKLLRNEWYPKNHRKLPADISWIDGFSLAIMFMDNGSLSHSDGQEDRATIACNFLSVEDAQRLADKIYNICGVDAVVYQSKGSNIRINSSPDTFGLQVSQMISEGRSCKLIMERTGCSRGTYYRYKNNPAIYRTTAPISNFWDLIAPYVVSCMKYKLPIEFQNIPYQSYPIGQLNYEAVPVVIRKITPFDANQQTMSSGSVGYDLETTSHNYMTQGLMGHNSLLILWNHQGEWNVSTKGLPDASGTLFDLGITYAEFFWQTLKKYVVGIDCFTPSSLIGSKITYMFELTSLANRVVCLYGKDPALTLIGARNLDEDGYPEIPVSSFKGFPVPIVKEYPLNSVKEIEAAALALDPMHNEGFVVVDQNFNRVKMKSPSYVMIHHLKEGFGNRRIIDLIKLGEKSEILTYIPEYTDQWTDIEQRLKSLVIATTIEYEEIKPILIQKDFALKAVHSRCSGTLFALRKGQIKSIQEGIYSIPTDKLEKLIGLKTDKCELQQVDV